METKTLDYEHHIKLWESSGISKVAYCKENNLSYHTFFYHLKKGNRPSRAKEFVQLKIKAKEEITSSDTIEVFLANGSRMVFSKGSSPRFIHEVIFG